MTTSCIITWEVMKGLYNESSKQWCKKSETQINGKILHKHRLEELILLKCPSCPKKTTDSMQFIAKYKWTLHRNRKTITKFIWNHKTLNMQTNLEQKEQSQRQHTIQLQNALKSYHHQNSMELAFKKKKKTATQESPGINPPTYNQMIFCKVPRTHI